MPLRTTNSTRENPCESRQVPIWGCSLFATEPLNKKTICLQLASFPSSSTGMEYIVYTRPNGWMHIPDMHRYEGNMHARKKSQKRKPKTRENRRADSAVHYALCVPFVGLNSTERYCSRVYSVLHTPYSILVRNTEEGFLAINQSLVPLVVSSMDQTMGHGCVYVQSTVVC